MARFVDGRVRCRDFRGRVRCRASRPGAASVVRAVEREPVTCVSGAPVAAGGRGKGWGVRLTDFWSRLEHVFGPAYAASVADDQVLPQLAGRTIRQALADGERAVVVWRAVCAAYPDRVPAVLR